MKKITLILALLAGFTASAYAQLGDQSPVSHEVIYCYNCDAQKIIQLLPANFTLKPNEHLQWSFETETGKGKLSLIEILDQASCPAKVRIIWQSKLTTPQKAVSKLIKKGRIQ